jgi:hypothetical protein
MTTIRHNPRSTRPIIVRVDDCIIKAQSIKMNERQRAFYADDRRYTVVPRRRDLLGSRNGVQPYRLSKLYRKVLPNLCVAIFWGIVAWGWIYWLVNR